MDDQPPPVEEIEDIIRRYLQAHPRAVDTERGIREWWLHGAQRPYTIGDVRAALRRLVATGELAERPLPDGQYIYAGASTHPKHDA